MAKQRYINTKIWVDNYFSDLDPIEKLVFLYLLTNAYTNLCGIYEIPIKNISFDTGIEKQMIEKIINRFTRDKKIWYIDGYICIRNFIKNQNVNPSVEKGIKREIEEKPKEIIDKVGQIYNLYTGCLQDGLLNLTLTKLNSNLTLTKVSEDTAIAESYSPQPITISINNVIEELKQKMSDYGIVYSTEDERIFAKHILSKKRNNIASQYKFNNGLEFAKFVIDCSMQDGNWRKYKVCSIKLLYQKYAQIINSYQEVKDKKSNIVSNF